MTTGTETKCGRPPNQYLELDNGIKLCARYRDMNSIGIEGKLSFFFFQSRGKGTPKPKLSMFFVLSQNHHYFCEK